ncbi:MAG TPA: lipocalin-like domain-containing protein [Bacteroidales bacterium]|nr:lipocalin-like domain-containing protein [Bacteroidales bacterium]HPR11607.1 lipocalin-like domain-containing protein [Bacteroidales bacterium]
MQMISDILKKMLFPAVLFLISLTALPQGWKTYPFKPAGSLVAFPADEGRHPSEPTEWWYTSGHLTGQTTGKHYSYMLSYFYSPLSIFDGFRIFNISDDDLGLFYNESQALNYNILATDSLNIEALIFQGGTETWRNKTDAGGNSLPFEYELSAVASGRSISLEYNALKPPLILADSGFLYEGASDYTYYFSLTGNAVTGTITLNGITENVIGSSWIDRQYGSFNPYNGYEYEWFCIQLSNGMDLAVNNLFTASDEIPDDLKYRFLGAYVDESNQYTTTDFQITRLKYSYMPDSLRCYSREWRITSPINDVDLIVSALHPYCEVNLPFRFYEGSTTVTGTVNGADVTGLGFAELLHSYDKPDIAVTDTTNIGDAASLLTWKLNNPDEGNPLKYDLEYSTDSLETFYSIAANVTDTFYYWNTQALSEERIWIKVTGYSVDGTLNNTGTTKLRSGANAINDNEYNDPVLIYPNPSTGRFIVEGKNIRKIRISDLSGRTVYSLPVNQSRQAVDISSRPGGLYFIEITETGGTTVTKMIIR